VAPEGLEKRKHAMAYWHHNQLIDHKLKDLGFAAKILGQFLAGCMNEHDQWRISHARMKTSTGMSLSSITKAMRELEAVGVLIAHRASKRQATQYSWALCCPLGCDVKSHREGVKEGTGASLPTSAKGVVITESTEPHTTESTEPHTTESTELLITNTPVNKPINKPIKKDIDPRDSGQTLLETLKAELKKLITSEKAPSYETHNGYGNPLERLALAIYLDPAGVEKKLNIKTKGAKHLGPYIEKTLINNPHTLMSEALEDCDLYDLEAQAEAAMAWNKTEQVRPWHDLEPHTVDLLVDAHDLGLGFDGPHVALILKTKPQDYEAMHHELQKLRLKATKKEAKLLKQTQEVSEKPGALADAETITSEAWQGVSKPPTPGPVAIVTVEAPTAPTEALTIDAEEYHPPKAQEAGEELARYDGIVEGLPEASRQYVKKWGSRGVFDYPLSVAVMASKKGLEIPETMMHSPPGVVENWVVKQRVTEKV
jgi:hypothetical protein